MIVEEKIEARITKVGDDAQKFENEPYWSGYIDGLIDALAIIKTD